MTDVEKLRRFISLFNEYVMSKAPSTQNMIGAAIDLLDERDIPDIIRSIESYLYTNPSDADLLDFWNSNSGGMGFQRADHLRVFYVKVLKQLKSAL